SALMSKSTLVPFKEAVAGGGVVRLLPVPGVAGKPRSFFEGLDAFMKGEGSPGLGYITFKAGEAKGPLVKFLSPELMAELKARPGVDLNDGVCFFLAGGAHEASVLAGKLRSKLGDELGLREKD